MINDTNKTMVIFDGKLITYIYSQDLNKKVVFVSILKVSYQKCINCALWIYKSSESNGKVV